jgi:F0F1-type ATP synthase membrane subunit b/b'
MSEEEDVSLEEKVANTGFTIGKYSFTPMKLIGMFTLVSTILGFLYGAFEVYKDYMDMKEQIQGYVAPDLSGFQEQLSVMEATMSKLQESVIEARDYTRDIKVDLKSDIDRIESVVDKTEQRVKDSEADVRDMIDLAETRFDTKRDQLSAQTESKLKSIEEDLNDKIQKALDNPLAN